MESQGPGGKELGRFKFRKILWHMDFLMEKTGFPWSRPKASARTSWCHPWGWDPGSCAGASLLDTHGEQGPLEESNCRTASSVSSKWSPCVFFFVVVVGSGGGGGFWQRDKLSLSSCWYCWWNLCCNTWHRSWTEAIWLKWMLGSRGRREHYSSLIHHTQDHQTPAFFVMAAAAVRRRDG